MSRIQRLLGRSVPTLMGVVATLAMSPGIQAAGAPAGAPPDPAPPAGAKRPGPEGGIANMMMNAAAPRKVRQGKRGAMIDLTGTWVSIVNEDWRFRMLTPPPGDYEGFMMSPAGRKQAGMWTPAMDGSCKAYGVGGIMRMPTRLKINWEGEDVLKIETDAGMQTRRLIFTEAPASGAPTLQGYSVARWQPIAPPAPPNPLSMGKSIPGGTLKVTTTHHTGGWLRKNGVPYGEKASIVEYYDRWPSPDGSEWMSVTTVVTDPDNLYVPYYTSSHFRKEANDSKWQPKPCKATD